MKRSAVDCDAKWAGCEQAVVVVSKYLQSTNEIATQGLCGNCRGLVADYYVRGEYWLSIRAEYVHKARKARVA